MGKAGVIQEVVSDFDTWSNNNNMSLNPTKCMSMTVCFSQDPVLPPPVCIANKQLAEVNVVKILGVQISSDLKWSIHIADVIKRASGRLYMLSTLKKFNLPISDLTSVYVGYIRQLLEYAVPVWHGGLTQEQALAIERIQKRACKIILGFANYTSYDDALQSCKLEKLAVRRDQICYDFANKLLSADSFHHWLPKTRANSHGRVLRNSHKFTVPRWRTNRYRDSAIPYMVNILNR